jgi:hypothetical protein
MKSDFSSIAFVARQNLVASGVSVSIGHTQQLLAASLGYASLAAIQASTEEAPGIAGADFVILDVAGLSARAESLGYGATSDQITDAIASAIKSDPEPPTVFLSTLDFIEDVAGRFANDTAMDHDAVADAAANTNAYFEGAYLEATEPEEALKDCREFWEIPVEGNVGMDQDPDKPFSGDNILVKGVVRVWKAGRVCLMNDMELDIGAGVDDSYYELDKADV